MYNEEVAMADVCGRTRIRLTDADRAAFLHGSCTNDIKQLRSICDQRQRQGRRDGFGQGLSPSVEDLYDREIDRNVGIGDWGKTRWSNPR